MAGERYLPGSLNLTAFWNLGDNTWKPGMDDNMLRLSALTSLSVLSRETVLPGAPVDGEIYIVPSTEPANANDIAIRDNGAWYYFTPTPGLIAHVQDVEVYYRWNSVTSEWIKLRADGDITIKERTGAYIMEQEDFYGNVVLEMNLALDAIVTIPTGLVKEQPVIIEATGTGVVEFAAAPGVTLHSADSANKLRVRYSSAVLMPKGNDVYSLSGDIEV